MTNGLHIGDVLDILSEVAPDVALSEALRVSRNIIELADISSDRVAQESYNKGHSEGYELGKRDAGVPSQLELTRLRRIEQNVMERASQMMPGIVFENGSHNKIQCIKVLRNRTGLGLKESKDISDKYIDSLSELADWERDLVDPNYVPRSN